MDVHKLPLNEVKVSAFFALFGLKRRAFLGNEGVLGVVCCEGSKVMGAILN